MAFQSPNPEDARRAIGRTEDLDGRLKRARQAGFDMVELHAGQAGLVPAVAAGEDQEAQGALPVVQAKTGESRGSRRA